MSALDIPMKIKWKPRRATLPETLICSQTEAQDLLRKQVFEDAIAAGWLEPCCVKKGVKENTKIYSVEAVQGVARRIRNGEYPQPKRSD